MPPADIALKAIGCPRVTHAGLAFSSTVNGVTGITVTTALAVPLTPAVDELRAHRDNL